MGCFGRTVEDVALGVAAMSGDYEMAKVQELHNKPRIAICKTSSWSQAYKETSTALAVARHAAESLCKGSVLDLTLPNACNEIEQVQARIMLSEMSRRLTFERIHYPKKLSALLLKQLDDGAEIAYLQYASDIIVANTAKTSIKNLFDNQVDILIAPSALGEAPLIKEGTGDPIFCRGWTLLGLPCASILMSQAAQMVYLLAYN